MAIENLNRLIALVAVLLVALGTVTVTAQAFGESSTGVKTLTWNNGRYHGQTRDGKRHGHGLMIWNNGDRYEGEWRNDKRHGRGIYTWANGDHYEGDFRNGKRAGRGVYIWGDGARYEGDFRDGERSGEGRFVDTDGWVEEGDWRNGDLIRFRSIPPFSFSHKNQQSTATTDTTSVLWGAFVAQLGAYGLSWNYPSKAEAIRSATAECSKRVNYECGVGDGWSTFSTNATGYDVGDNWFKTRCFAVGEYDYGGRTYVTGEGGDTKQEAGDAVRKWGRELGSSVRIVEAVCNER